MKNENWTRGTSFWNRIKLSSRMSLSIGILSVLVLSGLSFAIIFMGKKAINSALQGNMRDKTYLSIADLDNVVTQAEITANTIRKGIAAIYEQNDMAGGVPSNPWTIQDDEHNVIRPQNMAGTMFRSRVVDAVIPASRYNAETTLLDSIYSSMTSNESYVGIGVFLEPNAFYPGIENYGPYMSKADAKNKTVMVYPYSMYEKKDYYLKAKETKTLNLTNAYEDDSEEGGYVVSVVLPIVYKEEFKGVVIIDISMSVFDIIEQKDERFSTLYSSVFDTNGRIMYSMNEDAEGKQLKEIFPEKSMASLQSYMDKNEAFNTFVKNGKGDLVQFSAIPISIEGVSWWASVEVSEKEFTKAISKMIFLAIPVSLLGILLLVGFSHFYIRTALNPLKRIAKVGDYVAEGDFSHEINYSHQDEIGQIAESMAKVVGRIRAIIKDLLGKLDQMSQGNFAFDFWNPELYKGEYAPLLEGLYDILDDLNVTMGEIHGSSQQVDASAQQVSSFAQSLSVVSQKSDKINEIIASISTASEAEANGIKQLSNGLDQIALVVQSNTSTAEESATASEELSGQSGRLNHLLGKFNLKSEPYVRKYGDETAIKKEKKDSKKG